MKRLLVCAVVILACDRGSKEWVMRHVEFGSIHPMLTDMVRVTYTRNTGAAFGLLAGAPAWFREPLLIGVSGVACVMIIWWAARIVVAGVWLGIAYGCILGGAAGNLVDRVMDRSVVDFIDMGIGSWRWHTFNIADAAICTGVIMILIESFLRKEKV